MDKYQERGYANRQDYLQWLAINYEVPIDVVLAAADLLGPSEDFDGLINAIEEYW